jgi:GTPase SAR1 family protein
MIKDIKLHIWDLSGDKYYKNIAKRYINESIGILLVFDLSRKSTFNNLKSWIQLIDPEQIKKKKIILIGNKNDKNKVIEQYELNTFILTYGLEYYEINAKENTINGIFKNLVINIKLKQLNYNYLIGIKKKQYSNIKYVEETDNKQSYCCCSNI